MEDQFEWLKFSFPEIPAFGFQVAVLCAGKEKKRQGFSLLLLFHDAP